MHKQMAILLFLFLLTACAMPQAQATVPTREVTSPATVTVVQYTSQKVVDLDNIITPSKDAGKAVAPTVVPTTLVTEVVSSNPFDGINYYTEIALGSYFDGWRAAVDEQGNLVALVDGSNQFALVKEGVIERMGALWRWDAQAQAFIIPDVFRGLDPDNVVVLNNGQVAVMGEGGIPTQLIKGNETISVNNGLLLSENGVVQWWDSRTKSFRVTTIDLTTAPGYPGWVQIGVDEQRFTILAKEQGGETLSLFLYPGG